MASTDSNEQISSSNIRYFAHKLKLNIEAYHKALSLTGHTRERNDWVSFLNLCLLYLGSTLVVVGVMSFFAYNWQEMHKFTKFTLLQLGIIGMVLITYRKGIDQLNEVLRVLKVCS